MSRNGGDPPGNESAGAFSGRRPLRKTPINSADNYITGESVSPLNFEHPRFDFWLWREIRWLQAANSLLGGGPIGWFYVRRAMFRFVQWLRYGFDVSRYQCRFNIKIADQYVRQLEKGARNQ